MWAQRFQHGPEAVRRVGVVDIGLAAPGPGPDALQTTLGAFNVFQRGQNRLDPVTGRHAQTGGDHGV